jgi:hypothetical protein
MPAHPVQGVLLIHIGNRLEIEYNNKTTFLFGKEYAVHYFNLSPHIWDSAAFCMSGLHPVLKQQYVPLYCRGTTFTKWQLFAMAFKQRWYMASVSGQQRCFEYVTSTEANNSLRFLISNLRRVLNVVCFLLGDSLRLDFICRRFGALCLFHLHRPIGVEWLRLRNVGVFIGKMFGSKRAWAKPFSLHFLNIVILYLSAYEDGTDRVFRNVGV